jgi:hypothetical protein
MDKSRAEDQLDKAGGAIQKALDELKDLSSRLKGRIVDEKERRNYPVDDDAPGDTEEALRDSQER